MRDSTTLPDLRVLPLAALVPHEDHDPRRLESLCQRIMEAGVLKHPPIVAAIPDTDRFVVLDGANRIAAFTSLGFPHIVAQVVSYGDPGLVLDTWYHVVSGMTRASFEAAIKQIAGLSFKHSTLDEAREALAMNNAIAYIVYADGVQAVHNPNVGRERDIQLLKQMVDAYKGRADIFRASNDIWEKQAPFYPEITALVVFPMLRPKDIITAARSGEKIPSGISRHIIPNRALNINIPLEILRVDWSLERKQAWLRDWLMERIAANGVRFYAESTFLFDE